MIKSALAALPIVAIFILSAMTATASVNAYNEAFDVYCDRELGCPEPINIDGRTLDPWGDVVEEYNAGMTNANIVLLALIPFAVVFFFVYRKDVREEL